MKVGVLALQGDVSNHRRLLSTCGGVTDAPAVRTVAQLDEVDALVIPGGESSVIDKLSRLVGLDTAIRDRIAAGMPTLGTCAGMIMLADRIEGGIEGQQTFGGLDLLVRRNAFGRQVDSFEADLTIDFDLLAPGETDRSPFRAVFIRAPWVEQTGADVAILATAREHPVAVRQGNLVATAFHPELTGDARIHHGFVRLAQQQLAAA